VPFSLISTLAFVAHFCQKRGSSIEISSFVEDLKEAFANVEPLTPG
jgi:hypothetical protein